MFFVFVDTFSVFCQPSTLAFYSSWSKSTVKFRLRRYGYWLCLTQLFGKYCLFLYNFLFIILIYIYMFISSKQRTSRERFQNWTPPLSAKLSELSWLQVYEIFAGLKIAPDYLCCERFKGYSMEYNQVIIDYESGANNVLVVPSPNFPVSGKGLISDRAQVITTDTGLPYWGESYSCIWRTIAKFTKKIWRKRFSSA